MPRVLAGLAAVRLVLRPNEDMPLLLLEPRRLRGGGLKRAEEYLMLPRRPLKVREPMFPTPLPLLPPERVSGLPNWPDRLLRDYRERERERERERVQVKQIYSRAHSSG